MLFLCYNLIGGSMKKFLNILFMFFEVVALAWTMGQFMLESFIYYTILSNLFALIVGIIYFYYSYQKRIPKIFSILRLSSVLSLAVTFLVSLFILLPSFNFDFKRMYGGMNLFLHFVCPVMLFIIYLIYDKRVKLTKKDIIIANALTFVYGAVMVPLNILKVVEGPYPFLMVYKQSLLMTIIWLIVIVGGTTLLAFSLYKIKKK